MKNLLKLLRLRRGMVKIKKKNKKKHRGLQMNNKHHKNKVKMK